MFAKLLAAATSSASPEHSKPDVSTLPKKSTTSQSVQKQSLKTEVKQTGTPKSATGLQAADALTAVSNSVATGKSKQLANAEKLKLKQTSSLRTGPSKNHVASPAGPPTLSAAVKKNIGTSAVSTAKKPNFLEILKKAETVDAEKLKVTVKVKDHKKKPEVNLDAKPRAEERSEVRPNLKGKKSLSTLKSPSPGPPIHAKGMPFEKRERSSANAVSGSGREKIAGVRDKREDAKSAMKGVDPKSSNIRSSKNITSKDKARPTPAPFAQPMEGLVKKRKVVYETDSSLDDFIVSDEDNNLPQKSDRGYDREEIWSLFRRRPDAYTNYSDGEDDDMEATGLDVLNEEFRSTLAAKKEDELEAERERRLALEKRKRLKKT